MCFLGNPVSTISYPRDNIYERNSVGRPPKEQQHNSIFIRKVSLVTKHITLQSIDSEFVKLVA